MRSLLKWLAYTIAAIALVIVAGSYLLPSAARVSRTVEITAPPDKVFAIVASIRRFQEYSPWAELDPNAKYTFAGPETGVGQKLSWTSAKDDVGNGAMTITELVAAKRVGIDLDFGDMGKAASDWDFQPTATGSKVTWGFTSPPHKGVVMPWMGLMFDSWIGPDYEKGLGRLKALAEKV